MRSSNCAHLFLHFSRAKFHRENYNADSFLRIVEAFFVVTAANAVRIGFISVAWRDVARR